MLQNNLGVYSLKIILEIIKDIFYFPLWWYGRGFFIFLLSIFNFVKNQEKSLALLVWMKNIFKPMYGQTDWQGILVSIFIRIIQIIFRSIVMLVVILIALFLIIAWLLLPILTIYEIIFQLI
jgi:hypothetical protein